MLIKLYVCGEENFINKEDWLGPGYLVSNCSSKDVKIKVVPSRKDLVDCDLIGLSAAAWALPEAIDIVQNTEIPVVIGGPGTLWEDLQNYPFKHIVIGEGEKAFQKIINGEAKEKVIRENLIENLDTLKFPKRKISSKYPSICSARGCQFKCNYCTSPAFWGRVRYHSADYFIEEVKHLKTLYNVVPWLDVVDDTFIIDRGRFDKIHSLWVKNSFNTIRPRVYIRADIFNRDIAQQLKEMKTIAIGLGVETGSERSRKKLLNKYISNEQYQNTIDIGNEFGFKVLTYFMAGIPDETEEDIKLTEEFLDKNKNKMYPEILRFKPFPGTKYYKNESPEKMFPPRFSNHPERYKQPINSRGTRGKIVSRKQIQK